MKLRVFPHALFRTPCFSAHTAQIEELFPNPVFQEALFLASPDLYAEKKKADESGKLPYEEKLRRSLYKYASRSMTRPTPFGLFAGCSLAAIGEWTNINIKQQEAYQRCTRLDMHYMGALIQSLEKEKDIRLQLHYYPNDSLYELGGRLRYVEYYYKDARRVHQIASIEASDYVQHLLNAACEGKSIQQLATLLFDEEISIDEATDFIHELIDNQVLISELALKVTSTSPLDTLLKRLENLSGVAGITHSLQEIRNLLHHIDKSPVGSSIAMYDEIIAYIKTIGVAYEAPYLFQTDLYKPVVEASVSQTIIQKLLEGLHFLNKITHKPQESNLSKFREAFYARYEEQEMPLMEVLDKESGIGYPAGQNDGDLSPLINDLFLPGTPSNPTITLDAWTKTLLQKYVAAMQEKQSCIQLSDQDVENEKADWSDLPATFSCMCTLINEQEIYIHSAGGNATNLQGRFCHLHSDIEAHVKEITAKEQAMNPEAVYAEIVHLPESRIGNILFRPVLRDYEIPYLCKPGVNKGQVIPLHDLSISIRNGRIVLRSRAFNREIIPRLSSAHNYQNHSMPVYRFLCDMQYPAGRSGVFFSWGNLTNLFDYLPRVVYKNCILSPARWLIKKKDMEEWTKLSGTTLLNAITTYRENRRIPDKVVIPDNDNELFINFTDLLSIQTLLNIGKKRTNVVIEEFLFDEKQTFVKDEKGDVFCNEFIFSFYTTTDENKS